MKKSINIVASIAFIIAVVGFLNNIATVKASSPLGVVAAVASTSAATVGTQFNTTLFTAKPFCDARIISTVGQPIMISFDSNITPSPTVGHYQAASTTVAYDSGVYGCSEVKAYGFNASTTITKTETI